MNRVQGQGSQFGVKSQDSSSKAAASRSHGFLVEAFFRCRFRASKLSDSGLRAKKFLQTADAFLQGLRFRTLL